MTTDNQTTNSLSITHEEVQYSKAVSVGSNRNLKASEKSTISLKTLSLRPTKSVKKNSSFRPTKKLR